MLATQVQYWTLQENILHNRNVERETNRANKESEKISWFNANENARHNQVNEQIGWFNAYENKRHNIATEDIGYANIKLGYAQLRETTRHNLETEGVAWKNASTNALNARTNQFNAYTQARQVDLNYSLGLEANRISQQNAETNKRNAITNERNAATREFEAKTARYAAEQKAAVDMFNASTRANELENEKRRTDISQSTLDLKVQEYHWKQAMDVTNILLDVGKTVVKHAGEIKGAWNALQFATVAP